MVKRAPKKPLESTHLTEKMEDKEWHKWFDALDKKEHENYLRKLGLDDEDIDDWNEDIDEEAKRGKTKKSQKERLTKGGKNNG